MTSFQLPQHARGASLRPEDWDLAKEAYEAHGMRPVGETSWLRLWPVLQVWWWDTICRHRPPLSAEAMHKAFMDYFGHATRVRDKAAWDQAWVRTHAALQRASPRGNYATKTPQ